MADSNAVRQARKRAHAAGDHRLCRPGGGCERARLRVVPPSASPPGVSADPGARSVVVDVRAEQEAVIRRLAGAHEADPANAPLALALLRALDCLPVPGELDPLEARQAEVARRRRGLWASEETRA